MVLRSLGLGICLACLGSVLVATGCGSSRVTEARAGIAPRIEATVGRSGGEPAPGIPERDRIAKKPRAADSALAPLEGKLVPVAPVQGALLGSSVSISGHTALLAAPGARRAHVFVDNGNGWVEKTALAPAAASPGFGAAVAIWGDTALVGAPGDASPGVAGKVHVFVRVGNTWTEAAVLAPSDGRARDTFGAAVSLSGDTAVVGAPGADGGAPGAGAAYVFTRRLGTWTQRAKLMGSDAVGGAAFGAVVAAFGDDVLVGAPASDAHPPRPGAVYAFSRTDTGWAEEAKLSPPGVSAQDGFGKALARWEDEALIGAPGRSPQGAAYVFTRGPTGVWSIKGTLLPQEWSARQFGQAVALTGDGALVGASQPSLGFPWQPPGSPSAAGAAYLYRKANGSFRQAEKLTSANAAQGDAFGVAVAMSERMALVGASRDGAHAQGAGAAYLYRVSGDVTGVDLACSSATTLSSLATCIREQMPRISSQGFRKPAAAEQWAFRGVVASMLQGQCGGNLPASLAAPMRLVAFQDGDNQKTYCVLMETEDADGDGYVDRGWGTFIVDPAASRELIQEAPHPIADTGTETQAVDVFKETGSRSYLLCGAHRKANATPSACDTHYKEADCAHATANMYFPAVQEIAVFYGPRPHHHIQWHGMDDDTCTGLVVYASQGLASAPAQGAIVRSLVADAKAQNPAWILGLPGGGHCGLDATDNVEGRLLNGVPSAGVCTQQASAASGVFLHIEQHPDVRLPSAWIQAVEKAFPVAP
jgi:hypothetical protein